MIERYVIGTYQDGGIIADEHGDYVEYEDYTTLETEHKSAMLTISAIMGMLGVTEGWSISEQVAALLKERDALADENAALTSGCGFFAYDPDNGFEEFKTKDEAIEAAESYIDYYRGDACDGWADHVSQVSWGVVMQQSTKVDERPKNAEDSVSDYIETVCDFALLPAIITPVTDAAIASIRASEAKEISSRLEEKAEEFDKSAHDSDGFQTDNRYRFAAAMFRGFASQLRKEPTHD